MIAARDQNMAGAVSLEALGAASHQLDGGDQAPAYQYASNRPVNTVDVDNPKVVVDQTVPNLIATLTSPTKMSVGGFIVGKFPGGDAALSELDANFCDKLLSPGGAVTVAALDIIVQAVVGVLTGGGAVAAENLGGRALTTLFLKELVKASFHTVGGLLAPKTIATIGATEMYAIGLKLAASSLSGGTFSGAEQGPGYVQRGGHGMNLLNSRQLRQNYGRPIKASEALTSDQEYQAAIRQDWNNKGVFARYFEPQNPYSLTGAVAAATPSSFATSMTSLRSAVTQFGKVLQPLALFRVFGNMFTGGSAKALNDTYDVYNGIPQWGFSADELKKMRTDPTYRIGENELLISEQDISRMDTEIGKCFDGARSQYDVEKDPACTAEKLATDVAFRYRLFKLDSNIADMMQEDIPKTYGANTTTAGESENTGPDGGTNDGGFVWPMPHTSTISQCFGGGHGGLDIFGGPDAPIFAIASGTVTHAGEVTGYGPNFVAITHDSGGYGSSYGHMNTKTVAIGDHVDQGDQIGTQGNLGRSFGAHLHFNLFPGAYSGWDSPNVNPFANGLAIPAGVNNPKGCAG
jgi:Peptidase family M23